MLVRHFQMACRPFEVEVRLDEKLCQVNQKWSFRCELNTRPAHYEYAALPLSYRSASISHIRILRLHSPKMRSQNRTNLRSFQSHSLKMSRWSYCWKNRWSSRWLESSRRCSSGQLRTGWNRRFHFQMNGDGAQPLYGLPLHVYGGC